MKVILFGLHVLGKKCGQVFILASSSNTRLQRVSSFLKTRIGPEHTLNAVAFRSHLGIVIRLPTLPPEEP